MKRAIVVGCSTGIGRALAKELGSNGYDLGLAGRRLDLMEELRREIPTRTYVKVIDVSRSDEARRRLRELIDEMGGVELIVVNAGIGGREPDWQGEREILAVNVVGFAAVAGLALEYFLERRSGHLVGISSIAALRGLRPAYSGSKAFASTYLEGLRLKAERAGAAVQVTDVKPGFVATPMTEGRRDVFWVAPVDEAAKQIYAAIRGRRRNVYVTRRWRLVAWLMRVIPYGLLAWLVRQRR